MGIAHVQKEVTSWTIEDQDRLAAYLAVLRLQRTTAHAEELRRRLDDRAPESWLTLEEVKTKLRRNDARDPE